MRRSQRLIAQCQVGSTDIIQQELIRKKSKAQVQKVSSATSTNASQQKLSSKRTKATGKGRGQEVSPATSQQELSVKKIKGKGQKVIAENEDCQICAEEYPVGDRHWKELECKHKVCKECHSRLVTSGTTMSGEKCQFIKCPFCTECSGTQIGNCPDGTMTMTHHSTHLPGYSKYTTIVIQYSVNQKRYSLYRVAYLPNSPLGMRVYNLLRIAWDRRLCFTIGNSLTTGQQDVLVWNIHHKTSPSGGTSCFGYPDSTYLDRVLDELKQYNIE